MHEQAVELERIPRDAHESAFTAAAIADLCLVVGSTGLVYPAADIHIGLGASEALRRLDKLLAQDLGLERKM